MTKTWESEKDKLIEQMRDQYRGQQWAKSEKDSPFRSDSFDKWFDPDGVTMGEIPLTGRLFKRLGIAFGFVLAVSVGWLMAGGVIWTGYQETEVMRRSSATPLFPGGPIGSLRTSLPTIAFSGQEVVVHYEIDSDAEAAPNNTLARILISCLCPRSQWGEDHRILKSGEGSIVLPVKHSSLFSVYITQSPRSDGTVSRGFYWWGVRNGK